MEAFAWNPRHNGLPRPFRDRFIGPRTNNFGDLLGPVVVQAISDREGLRWPLLSRPGRLITIGSVLHVATPRDVVWGSGVNGNVRPERHRFTTLDVRAVRGPRTWSFLADRGLRVPEVFGDPALLLPYLFPVLTAWATEKRHAVTVVPNLHDWQTLGSHPRAVDPRSGLWHVLRTIAQSEHVVASSLHGLVVAEALGIPATVLSGHEKPFKYQDYYEGTGRQMPSPAQSLDEALHQVPEPPDLSTWDAEALYRAFPRSLWAEAIVRPTDHSTPTRSGAA